MNPKKDLRREAKGKERKAHLFFRAFPYKCMKRQYQRWYLTGHSFKGASTLTDMVLDEVAEWQCRYKEMNIAYQTCSGCYNLGAEWCPFLGQVDSLTNAVVELGCTRWYD